MAKKLTTYEGDGSMNLFIRHDLAVSIYHIASDREVAFKSILTSYSETFNSDWDEQKVYGRADPIVTFRNTTRKITLAWQTVGYNIQECINNLGAVGLLASMMYPSYQINSYDENEDADVTIKNATLSASPIVKLKFLNLIANSDMKVSGKVSAKRGGLLGKIGNLSIEHDKEAGYIHVIDQAGELSIEPDASSGYTSKLVPKIINVSIDFTVIHEHPVGWGVWEGSKKPDFFVHDSGQADGVPNSAYPYNAHHTERPSDTYEKDVAKGQLGPSSQYTKFGRNKFVNKLTKEEIDLESAMSKYNEAFKTKKVFGQ